MAQRVSHHRSRKRRAARTRATGAPEPTSPAPIAASQPAAPRVVAGRRGERPRPPWHPVPLSELLILAGAIALIIGLGRGPDGPGREPIELGVVAVAVGTFEVVLREHRGGFRSHTVLLAFLPVVVFHTVAVLVIQSFTPVTHAITIGLLVADVAIFALAFRMLRTGYRDAKHRRVAGIG